MSDTFVIVRKQPSNVWCLGAQLVFWHCIKTSLPGLTVTHIIVVLY